MGAVDFKSPGRVFSSKKGNTGFIMSYTRYNPENKN